MTDWALATTPANSEHLVADDLGRAGYEFHFFRWATTRAFRGRVITAFRPAFPRYLFVPFEVAWEVVIDVWRVLGLVCFGEQVAKVRGSEVDALVERCNGSNGVDVLPPEAVPELYAHGERVHIGGVGLIAGHDAYYEGVAGDGKLRVMVDMLGRMVPIDVDARDVSVSSGKQQKQKQKRKRGRRRKGRALDPSFA